MPEADLYLGAYDRLTLLVQNSTTGSCAGSKWNEYAVGIARPLASSFDSQFANIVTNGLLLAQSRRMVKVLGSSSWAAPVASVE